MGPRTIKKPSIDIGGDDVSVTAPIGQPVCDPTRSCAQIQAPPRRIHRQFLERLHRLGIRVPLSKRSRSRSVGEILAHNPHAVGVGEPRRITSRSSGVVHAALPPAVQLLISSATLPRATPTLPTAFANPRLPRDITVSLAAARFLIRLVIARSPRRRVMRRSCTTTWWRHGAFVTGTPTTMGSHPSDTTRGEPRLLFACQRPPAMSSGPTITVGTRRVFVAAGPEPTLSRPRCLLCGMSRRTRWWWRRSRGIG